MANDDPLAAVQGAQRRVWELQAAGEDPNSPEARRAMNQLMTRLRHLTPEDFARFEAWRAAERGGGTTF